MERTITNTIPKAAPNFFRGRQDSASGLIPPSPEKGSLRTSKEKVFLHRSAVHFSPGTAVQFSPRIYNGADKIPENKFDYIYANIQRNILLNDMPEYCNVLKLGGELIMSGFYSDDLEPIKMRAAELGLRFKRFTDNENWIAAVFISE